MEAAQTVDEFFLVHRKTAGGLDLLPSRVTRAGVNLLQLLDTDTIEFRCFTMSKDSRKLLSAFRWPLLYMNAALFTDASPEEILKDNKNLQFQHVYPYRYNLDWIFQLTNLRHNSRPQVKATYEDLIKRGILTRKELGWE